MNSEIVIMKVIDKDKDGILMTVKDEVNIADKIRIPIHEDESKDEIIEKLLKQINVLYRHYLKNADFLTHHVGSEF